jgi:DNA-directed RNA polymerase subunit RPC12/RpoP
MHPPAENETIPCRTCGARLDVGLGDERVRCEHCGATTEIPAEVRTRVAAHADVVAQAQAQARRLTDQAAMHGLAARTNVPLLAAILVFACAVPAWIMAHGTGATAAMGPLAWTIAVTLTASPLLVLAVAKLRWHRRARPTIDAARESGRCGACGGPLALVEGEGLLRCTHCAATVVATPQQMTRLEHAAEQRRLAAHHGVAAASAENAGSLDAVNRGLHWLTDGPLGFGPFFAVSVIVVGLIMFVAMVFAPGMDRAAYISLGVCVGLGLLGLVWGLVLAAQRVAWRWIVRASGPRWGPRWELVRDAIGLTPPAACSIISIRMRRTRR